MSRRWYKRCGADFIHGTMNLTLEEKGAYSLCLDLIYDRGGPIPDDARWLSGVCGVSLRKWASLRQRLLDLGKLTAENGSLTNARADLEIVSAELSSRKLSESGAKGGRTRAENASAVNENSKLGQAGLKHIREDKNREEREVTPPKGGLAFDGKIIRLSKRDFQAWTKAYPSIDIMASLQSRDDWLATEADEKTRKRWFMSTSNHLANLQQKAVVIQRAPVWDGMP